MEQLLPRGFEIEKHNRVQKSIAQGEGWEIYLTSLRSYALAAERTLFQKWVSEFALPEQLFTESDTGEIFYIPGHGDYLIASVASGPYPNDIGQIEAFSAAFSKAVKSFPQIDLCDAVYLEEYSLLLPTSFTPGGSDNRVVYGKWITGGVEVPVTDFDRISALMSWLPRERLISAAAMAGFTVSGEAGLPGQDMKARTAWRQPELEENSTEDDRVFRGAGGGTEGLSQGQPFSLPGRRELESFFREHIIDVVTHREAYARMGIPFPGATVLYGPPGCGKTFAVEKLCEYLGWPMFQIDSGTVGSSYIHDTSRKIAGIFRSAQDAAPSVIVIDEMEAFLSSREGTGTMAMHHMEEVAEFLRRIPEATAGGVLVFAMTNMLDSIDPALLRRGRFDHIIEVKMADAEDIEELLKKELSALPVDDTVNVKQLALQLEEHPLSDVTFVLREAGRLAVKRQLASITGDCIEDALELLPKQKERRRIGF